MGVLLPNALSGAGNLVTIPAFVSWSKWTIVGLAIGGVFAAAWWLLLEPLSEDDFTTHLEIPAGTASAIAAGEPAPFIPDRINLAPGGTLLVLNRDSVEHRVGGFRVPAESEATIVPESEGGELLCSIHPSGALGVGPVGRPALYLMLLPMFMVGLPVGLVCWLVSMIGSRLDMDSGATAGSS